MDHEEREFEGEDAFGRFKILGISMATTDCPICGCKTPIVIEYYNTPKVNDYVKKARSFLLRIKGRGGRPHFHRKVGINCGCYAKVHRQVVHITGGNHA